MPRVQHVEVAVDVDDVLRLGRAAPARELEQPPRRRQELRDTGRGEVRSDVRPAGAAGGLRLVGARRARCALAVGACARQVDSWHGGEIVRERTGRGGARGRVVLAREEEQAADEVGGRDALGPLDHLRRDSIDPCMRACICMHVCMRAHLQAAGPLGLVVNTVAVGADRHVVAVHDEPGGGWWLVLV